MPTYNDSDNIEQMVPEGDYKFTVVQFDEGISSGAATAGSTMYKLKLEIALIKPGTRGPTVYENLIDNSKTAWKIDTFLKSAGIKIPKGTSFEFDKSAAAMKGVAHVNPYGLRGWCRLLVDDYQGKKKNKVAMFYTDKEKLARDTSVAPPAPVPFSEPEADPAPVTGIDDEDVPF